MNQLPAVCPICEGELVILSMNCRQCDTTVSGRFTNAGAAEFDEAQLPVLRRFARLSPEQLQLLEAFIRCEGRLNRLQEEVNLSYPTLRARLDDMVRDLGFSPREEEQASRIDRRQVLDDLQAGRLSADEAARLLRESRS
jgi:hypothetical protein